MTLSGRYALCCRKDAYFEAHHKNLTEDRPILSAATFRPMTLVSGDIRFVRIFAEIPRGVGVKRQWVCRERQFSAFSMAIFSDTLEMRPAYCVCTTQSVVGFSVIPKCMTLMTLNSYFALNSVFAPVWLASTVRRSKNNCVKTNKDRRIKCQRRKSLTGILVSDSIRFLWIFARVL